MIAARYVYGRRAFAVIGPTVWDALSNDLRDPELSIASLSLLLKTIDTCYIARELVMNYDP